MHEEFVVLLLMLLLLLLLLLMLMLFMLLLLLLMLMLRESNHWLTRPKSCDDIFRWRRDWGCGHEATKVLSQNHRSQQGS